MKTLVALLLILVTPALDAATITVTHEGDGVSVDSMVTLREAMISINGGADVNSDVTGVRSGVYGNDDEIRFLIGAGPQTIAVGFPLPVITVSAILNGESQPGFETEPIITIDGAAAGPQANGVVIDATTTSLVKGLQIQNFGGTGLLIVQPGGDHTPPVAHPQSLNTAAGAAIDIQLTASDPDDTSFTFAIVNAPIHGSLSGFDPEAGTLVYTPDTGYTGDDSFTFTASDESHTSAPATVAIEIAAVPGNLVAEAVSTTRVEVTWGAVSGATYELDRRAPGTGWQPIATPATTFYGDDAVSPATSYQYRVRAVVSGSPSPNSNTDLATTIEFADDPLTPGLVVKAAHLSQMRAATNAVRTLAGLGETDFTDPATAGTTIKALHVSQMRSALDEARGLLGLTTGGYTDGALEGVIVKAMHAQELRARVQ